MSHSKKYRDGKKLTLAGLATKTPGGGGGERTVCSNERERRNCDVIREGHSQRTSATATCWSRSGVRRRDLRSCRLKAGAAGSGLVRVRVRTTVTEFSLGACGLLGLSQGESDGEWREREDEGGGQTFISCPAQPLQLLESQGTSGTSSHAPSER